MRSRTLERDLLVGTTGVLLAVGLVLLSSATTVAGFQRFSDPYFYVKHQLLFGVLPGVVFFLIAKRLSVSAWKVLAPILYVGSLVLLGLVLLPHVHGIGAARSWIVVGPVSLQPSEVAKFALILMLAYLRQGQSPSSAAGLRGFGWFLLVVLPVVAFVAVQPDLGTLVIIAGISLTVYFLSGGSVLAIGLTGAAGVAGIIAASLNSPYRLARLTVFVNNSVDPQGVGYHVRQALIAIGSGGIWGRGLGHSIQKFKYLPEVQSDSLFAIAAEELGFVLTSALLLLIVVFWKTMYTLALSLEDRFSRLAVGGVLCWFVIQTFLNIGAMLGLLPLTGVPLPLLSYGGTALATELAALGFVMGVTRQR